MLEVLGAGVAQHQNLRGKLRVARYLEIFSDLALFNAGRWILASFVHLLEDSRRLSETWKPEIQLSTTSILAYPMRLI